jgi:hypothetical protein
MIFKMQIIFYLFFVITIFDILTNYLFQVVDMLLLLIIIPASFTEIYLLIKIKKRLKRKGEMNE